MKSSDDNQKSEYNLRRSITFAQDRADLTLWEISKFYKAWDKLKGSSSQVKCTDIKEKLDELYEDAKIAVFILDYEDCELICNWLKHFDSFENYTIRRPQFNWRRFKFFFSPKFSK